jgi:hypothetical protein
VGQGAAQHPLRWAYSVIPDLPPFVIVDDRGGMVAAYDALAEKFASNGRKVEIRGYCQSACTILLALPPGQICAHDGAEFWFHQASESGSKRRSDPATSWLMGRYPEPVRAWLDQRGGLTVSWLILRGAEMRGMVRACA